MGDVFSHLDNKGHPRMVDVSKKEKTLRMATAYGKVHLTKAICDAISDSQTAKGNVLLVAETAGILAAKRTSDLIPLCHPIRIDYIDVRCTLIAEELSVVIEAEASASEVTGIEMEALTAVSVAALTIYDMCKAIDKGITIERIYLSSKSGGKSGNYDREKERSSQ